MTPQHHFISSSVKLLSKGQEGAQGSGLATLAGTRAPLSCHEAEVTNEGPGAAWGSARLRAADTFTGAVMCRPQRRNPECPLTPAFPSADRPHSALSQSSLLTTRQPHPHHGVGWGALPAVDSIVSLPRTSCCLEQMFSTTEVATGAGAVSTPAAEGLSTLFWTGPRATFLQAPPLALDPETLANVSELRFRNDLSTESLVAWESVCCVF